MFAVIAIEIYGGLLIIASGNIIKLYKIFILTSFILSMCRKLY